jgi:hypothetical protein
MTHTSHTDTTSEHNSRRLSVKHHALHSVARQRAMRGGRALGRSGGKLAGGALAGDTARTCSLSTGALQGPRRATPSWPGARGVAGRRWGRISPASSDYHGAGGGCSSGEGLSNVLTWEGEHQRGEAELEPVEGGK